MTQYHAEIFYNIVDEEINIREVIAKDFSDKLFIGTDFNGILASYPHDGYVKVIIKQETVSEAEAYLRAETESSHFIAGNDDLVFSHINIKARQVK